MSAIGCVICVCVYIYSLYRVILPFGEPTAPREWTAEEIMRQEG